MLDQKPRLLIFSFLSRGSLAHARLVGGGHYSRAATIRERLQFLELSTSTSICVLFCIFHNPQFKSSIKTSFLLGGSHTYPMRYKTLYCGRTLRAIIGRARHSQVCLIENRGYIYYILLEKWFPLQGERAHSLNFVVVCMYVNRKEEE